MDENSPPADGLDSATDLGSEVSLNVPPEQQGYAGSWDTGVPVPALRALDGSPPSSGLQSSVRGLNPKWKYWEESENR